nr:MAG TPA: hypothetical protein [Caudoviricetes sp.]
MPPGACPSTSWQRPALPRSAFWRGRGPYTTRSRQH